MAYQSLRICRWCKNESWTSMSSDVDEIDLLAVKNPSMSEDQLHEQMKVIVMDHYLAIRRSTHGSESRIKLFDRGYGSKLGNAIESFLKLDAQFGPDSVHTQPQRQKRCVLLSLWLYIIGTCILALRTHPCTLALPGVLVATSFVA